MCDRLSSGLAVPFFEWGVDDAPVSIGSFLIMSKSQFTVDSSRVDYAEEYPAA